MLAARGAREEDGEEAAVAEEGERAALRSAARRICLQAGLLASLLTLFSFLFP